mmetsp:Transcript_7138/g.14324  ORF Transcript_7138/g.14324 Transcript_7138/m.14324 type:complete len:93 (-) Transcript_7138:110-388(-)
MPPIFFATVDLEVASCSGTMWEGIRGMSSAKGRLQSTAATHQSQQLASKRRFRSICGGLETQLAEAPTINYIISHSPAQGEIECCTFQIDAR